MGATPNSHPDIKTIMSATTGPSRKERRMKAAQLLEAVIEETLDPRMAINRWPEATELPDPSLDCAYLALWHFEADEAQQKSEVFYLDAQLELLQQITNHLKADRDLPPYILRTYRPSTPIRFYYPRSFIEASLLPLKGLWREIQAIFLQAFSLILTARR